MHCVLYFGIAHEGWLSDRLNFVFNIEGKEIIIDGYDETRSLLQRCDLIDTIHFFELSTESWERAYLCGVRVAVLNLEQQQQMKIDMPASSWIQEMTDKMEEMLKDLAGITEYKDDAQRENLLSYIQWHLHYQPDGIDNRYDSY